MDESTFGGETIPGAFGGGSASVGFGDGLSFGESKAADNAELPANAQATEGQLGPDTIDVKGFGKGLTRILGAPDYRQPDPAMSALDQTADTLQQRIRRANDIAANPLLQFFAPEGVQKARDFVPAAAEKLQQIRTQQANIVAGKRLGETLGLAPGEVPDEATMEARVQAAVDGSLKGDLRKYKGLQAVDPLKAAAIADQVFEVTASHLNDAQFAFDKLSNMRSQGEYMAAVNDLRRDGKLGHLEALGLKVPPSFEAFSASKGREAQALRDARIGIDTVRTKLEQRNTFQNMEKNEALTYKGRIKTPYGDDFEAGVWGRRAVDDARGLIVNGAADPRTLGKSFAGASPEQRKAIAEDANNAVPKVEIEKARAFDRTYELAKPTPEQAKRGDAINTNPNVQQAIAEQLASMLRGGSGGATSGLLNIETSKRGYVQALLDKITAGYAGGINTITGKDVRGYMTKLTQGQIREVIDVIKAHNDELMEDRIAPIARRAGALGLDTTAFGWGKEESAGVVGKAVEEGRMAMIERLLPYHQAIGGGDGVFMLGAQRPGTGATAAPAGTTPTTQIPGSQPLQTPVQQGNNPPPAGPSTPPVTGPAGGAPITIAGQTVNVSLPPGASPQYLASVQRIESGNKKDPWTASVGNGPDGKPLSSAKGAFQAITSTWMANKPPGAPDDPRKATPQQQAEFAATLTRKNAASLQANRLPVNDTTLYMAHNLGAGGAATLLQADPNADARSVVGEEAARNNPTFFKGRPTVAKVLERYTAEMNQTPEPDKPKSPAGGATAEAPSFLQRVSRALSQGIAGGDEAKDKAVREVGQAAVENAPAIASIAGAVIGSAGGPAGTVVGGAAGGGAGQALKDYLQGNEQSPAAIAKETALGGVLGVGKAARPIASAVVRAAGAGAAEAGAKAAEGGEAADITEAGLKGAGLAAGGEAFGRALGMAGHKVWNMFAPDAKKAVQEAAGKYAAAEETLAKEAPKLPGVGGAAGGDNPKFKVAEKAKEDAERVLKDAGLVPEEAAYAHKVSTTEGGNIPVPKQEAQAARPGALEQERIGKGYQQLESEVGAKGVGAVKSTPKLPDGPIAAVENKKVPSAFGDLAERVELAITAPAPNWQAKWVQLKDERSKLLTAEREALSSTDSRRGETADAYRTLADTVRKQQEKAAKYVFGEKDGEAFVKRLKVLDVRYRNLMEATNGGDLAAAAKWKGEKGRDADKAFRAMAQGDPMALRAWAAMRGSKGDLAEATVPWTVAAEGLPVVGKVVKVAKLGTILTDWYRNRTAGSPSTFGDFVKAHPAAAEVNQSVRNLAGTIAQRNAGGIYEGIRDRLMQ